MNKYHNQKTIIDGIVFDSKKEANRYCELKLMEKGKYIKDLQRQVPFTLIPKSKYGREIKYVADFTYYIGDEFVIEDVKGIKTDVYKLKARMMAEKGLKITEI